LNVYLLLTWNGQQQTESENTFVAIFCIFVYAKYGSIIN